MSKKRKNKKPQALEQELELLEVDLDLKTENVQSEEIKLDTADEMIELIDIDDENYHKVDAFGNKKDEDEFADVEFIQQDDKKKKTGKYITYQVFRTLVTMVALVAFAYASYELALVYLENDMTFDTKNEISNMFLVDVENDKNGNVYITSDGETIAIENTSNGKAFVWNYQKMLEYNSEAVGYIRQDNGDYIDYPILQHSDNEYYLYHLPDHTWSSMGSIFLDYRIQGGLEADYSIVYGHYIGKRANNIMFGSLNWYWDWPSYHKEHPTFDIYVKERHYKYYVFSIMKVPASGDPVYNTTFESDEARFEFFKDVESRSQYEFTQAPELTKDSKVIMLSTCTTDKTVRFVMFLVRGEEIKDVPGVDYDETSSNEKESSSKEDETTAPEETSSGTTEPGTDNTTVEPDSSQTPNTPTEPDSSDEPSSSKKPDSSGQTTVPSQEATTTVPPTSSSEQSSSNDNTTAPEETTSGEESTKPTSSEEQTSLEPAESDDNAGESTGSEEQTTPME